MGGADGGLGPDDPPLVLSPHCSPSTLETSVAVSVRTCQNALDMLDGKALEEDALCPAQPSSWVGQTAAELNRRRSQLS